MNCVKGLYQQKYLMNEATEPYDFKTDKLCVTIGFNKNKQLPIFGIDIREKKNINFASSEENEEVSLPSIIEGHH
jgi:hypothetical protein